VSKLFAMTQVALLLVGFLQATTATPGYWLPPSPRPLPMARVEACKLEWTYKDGGFGPRWISYAVYDVKADRDGAVVSMILRPTENIITKFAKLDQFEACVRNWRFEGTGDYTVMLRGGSMSDSGWTVRVTNGDRGFQLHFPLTVVP
jgi:hypothetical protein